VFTVLAVYGLPSLVKDKKKGNYLKPTGYMEIVMLGLSFGHHLTMFISAMLGSGAAEISCNNLNRTLACTVAERLD
jgi:hypothetical protein